MNSNGKLNSPSWTEIQTPRSRPAPRQYATLAAGPLYLPLQSPLVAPVKIQSQAPTGRDRDSNIVKGCPGCSTHSARGRSREPAGVWSLHPSEKAAGKSWHPHGASGCYFRRCQKKHPDHITPPERPFQAQVYATRGPWGKGTPPLAGRACVTSEVCTSPVTSPTVFPPGANRPDG